MIFLVFYLFSMHVCTLFIFIVIFYQSKKIDFFHKRSKLLPDFRSDVTLISSFSIVLVFPILLLFAARLLLKKSLDFPIV